MADSELLGGQPHRLPFAARVLPLYVAVYPTFFVWWWLMVLWFGNGLLLEGLAVAYSLPAVVSLVAAGAAVLRKKQSAAAYLAASPVLLAAYGLLLALSANLPSRWVVVTPLPDAGPLAEVASGGPFSDLGALVGIGLISAVVSIMLSPMAGLQRYFAYRRPLFVAGVIFMPLFIALAAALRAPYQLLFPPPEDNIVKGYVVLALMVGFWGSAAWLAAARTQGAHHSGLAIRPLLTFRPDFILPGGVLLVKGIILSGVGLMIMIHDHPGFPRWNWWGFVLAFWGIVVLVPLRGIVKMAWGRRRRMLGESTAFGTKASLAREMLLFAGLLVLLYGFVSAFKGFVPFAAIGTFPRYNALPSLPGLLGVALIVAAFAVLVLVRAWFKSRLVEGAETTRQLVGKQLILYAGILLLILGFIQTFGLPADATMTGQPYIGFFPSENPFGFGAGVTLFALGAILILGLRPVALRNELAASIRAMVGVVADAPESIRRQFVERRVGVLCRMPEAQRDFHVRCMLEGLRTLPDDQGISMRQTMMEFLLKRPSEDRVAVMRSMDKVLFGLEATPRRRRRRVAG